MRKTLWYAAAIAAGSAAGIALALALASPPGHQARACHRQVAGAVPSPATAVQRAIASEPPICG